MECAISRQISEHASDWDREQAELERKNILKARAKTLAGMMIDNRDACEVTGVTLSEVTGTIDDNDEFDKLVFGAANGCEASCRLLKDMLEKQAAELILMALEILEGGAGDDPIAQRRAARYWGDRA